ncbi:hypothetical protein [Ligilactobacillus hayakitensis]|uniref:hypothetical protein n=1 Tax=Ligilactobacillus hayakitensis TaxID=396716 RepID=UPI0004682315|nr:hypothetical protein [Ligilactobacillus hayakitensis]
MEQEVSISGLALTQTKGNIRCREPAQVVCGIGKSYCGHSIKDYAGALCIIIYFISDNPRTVACNSLFIGALKHKKTAYSTPKAKR